jgi:hypothetical protein
MLRAEQGEGRKERHAMLSPTLLRLLCEYWFHSRCGETVLITRRLEQSGVEFPVVRQPVSYAWGSDTLS